MIEGRISECEDRSIEINQSEQKEKGLKKKKLTKYQRPVDNHQEY